MKRPSGSQGPTIQDSFVQRQGAQETSSNFSGGFGGTGGGGSSDGGGPEGSGASSHGGSGGDFNRCGSQDLKAGWDKISNLEEWLDKLESTQSGGEDAVVLPSHIVLQSKQDVVGMLEGFLGANCDIPVEAFISPHFLFNEIMVTLGCNLPNLDEFTKLKQLNVKVIDLRNSQALMMVLPVFFTASKLSMHIYSSGATGRFRAFPNAKE